MKWHNVVRLGAKDVDIETGRECQKPRVTNVVATCFLGILLYTFHPTKYAYMQRNRKKFVTCLMRINEPKSVLLLFRSGKLVATGARSPSASHCSVKFIEYYIWKTIGFPTQISGFKIQNITGAAKAWPLSLPRMFETHNAEDPTKSRWVQKSFPGLRLSLGVPGKNIKATFFASGNVTFSGAKNVDDINYAYEVAMVECRRFPADNADDEHANLPAIDSDSDVDYDDDD